MHSQNSELIYLINYTNVECACDSLVLLSGLVRGTTKSIRFDDTEEMLSPTKPMYEKRYGFDAARCAGATLKRKKQ
jgi:hypothetical protein